MNISGLAGSGDFFHGRRLLHGRRSLPRYPVTVTYPVTYQVTYPVPTMGRPMHADAKGRLRLAGGWSALK